MRAAPFLLIIVILLGGLAIAFETVTGSPDDSTVVAERPTVTPRPRPTSPSQLAESAPTSAPSGFTESGAAAAPLSAPQQAGGSPTAAAAASTATPIPTPTAVPPAPSPTPAPTAQTNAPAIGQVLTVGNTDGEGVFLRRTPQMNDKIRAWLDKTPMVVVGPPVTGDGHEWQHVRAPDGTEGYIPVEYLVGG